jgi:hypothetical protein
VISLWVLSTYSTAVHQGKRRPHSRQWPSDPRSHVHSSANQRRPHTKLCYVLATIQGSQLPLGASSLTAGHGARRQTSSPLLLGFGSTRSSTRQREILRGSWPCHGAPTDDVFVALYCSCVSAPHCLMTLMLPIIKRTPTSSTGVGAVALRRCTCATTSIRPAPISGRAP